MNNNISRRNFIRAGAFTLLGTAGAAAVAQGSATQQVQAAPPAQSGHANTEGPTTVGEVNHERNGFNPTDVLIDFDYGQVSTLPNGQTLREYNLVAMDKTIEIAPGIEYPAWVYNGRMPGPTLRCTEGDRIRVHFSNGSSHPHTIHFHSIHPYEMDGVPGAGGPASFARARALPTSSTPSRSVCTCTTVTSFRWPGILPRGCMERSSSIQRTVGLRWTTSL